MNESEILTDYTKTTPNDTGVLGLPDGESGKMFYYIYIYAVLRNCLLSVNKNIPNLHFILDDLLHVNYLIAGLFLLVMIVFGVWIKFFVSWKRELESSNYDIDDQMVNNCDAIDPKVEKDDVFQNISEEDKNEIKSKTEYNKNDDEEMDKSHFDDIHTT